MSYLIEKSCLETKQNYPEKSGIYLMQVYRLIGFQLYRLNVSYELLPTILLSTSLMMLFAPGYWLIICTVGILYLAIFNIVKLLMIASELLKIYEKYTISKFNTYLYTELRKQKDLLNNEIIQNKKYHLSQYTKFINLITYPLRLLQIFKPKSK